MRIVLSILAMAAFGIVAYPTNGQGIVNGGFENYDPASGFLAGWHAYFPDRTPALDYGATLGGESGSRLAQDYGISHPEAAFYATLNTHQIVDGGMPVGNYYFYGKGVGSPPGNALYLEQRFVVPGDAHTLQYRGFGDIGLGVNIDGSHVDAYIRDIVRPETFLYPRVSDFWLDISKYAGQEITVTFDIHALGIGLDIVRTSSEVIPEPSTLAMLGLGIIGTCFVSRRTEFKK